jgi:hypothetical protein
MGDRDFGSCLRIAAVARLSSTTWSKAGLAMAMSSGHFRARDLRNTWVYEFR